ncbi:MAG: DUF342 domain-containing protein, partial [Desulfocapsa sp.]|nr:DUF342 domain-containing protein [Desulfocapsa sp.]
MATKVNTAKAIDSAKRTKEEQAPPTLVPKFSFQTETLTGKDNTSFQTVELVRKGEVLVELIEASKILEQNTSELVPAKHTLLSDDKSSLVAEVDGFPIVSTKTTKDCNIIMISMVPLLSVSDDSMSATICLYPPLSKGHELNLELLQDILISNNLRHGISTEALERLLQSCKKERILIKNEVFAEGLLPEKGIDSFLKFDIEVGPLPGTVLEGDRIDFRERKMFVGVAKGQKIATRIPPTDGIPGIDVCGENIAQIPGRIIPVAVSDDAEFDEESGIVRASHSGILSLVNENSIKVCAKQVIPGNVDYNTGNIESHDAVEINGTILPGFKVKTRGDILLKGNVRAAIIKCKGNLVVKGGILGKKCRVKVSGDADINFMEQGRLRVKGKVIIRKQAYYARIMADGQINCKENGQIMSGFLMSASSLNLGNVGTAKSPSALLAAGISPGRYLRYLKMRSRLKDIEEERLSFL